MYSEKDDLAHHLADIDRFFDTLATGNAALAQDALVLDVGGGGGIHSGMLSNRVHRVYCSDFADQNLRYEGTFIEKLCDKFARNDYAIAVDRLEFHAVDAMNLIYRDNLFDAIVSFNAFEHIPDPGKALSEMLRVTKPGGLIYLTFDPVWTCDSGSHFYHRVPAPWQHLLSSDDDYAVLMRRGGATDAEVQEFRTAMNRRPLGYYVDLFDRFRSRAEFLVEYAWSGCAAPSNASHPNWTKCRQAGFSEADLMTRGLSRLIRKPA